MMLWNQNNFGFSLLFLNARISATLNISRPSHFLSAASSFSFRNVNAIGFWTGFGGTSEMGKIIFSE